MNKTQIIYTAVIVLSFSVGTYFAVKSIRKFYNFKQGKELPNK